MNSNKLLIIKKAITLSFLALIIIVMAGCVREAILPDVYNCGTNADCTIDSSACPYDCRNIEHAVTRELVCPVKPKCICAGNRCTKDLSDFQKVKENPRYCEKDSDCEDRTCLCANKNSDLYGCQGKDLCDCQPFDCECIDNQCNIKN